MSAKRLLTLADHLDTVPKREFDMAYWKCGTTACAIGHACSIPSFRRAGLKLVGAQIYDDGAPYIQHYPEFDDEVGFDAAANFFDIDDREAESLFGYREPETPKRVAKRIRKFIADKQESEAIDKEIAKLEARKEQLLA